MLIILLLLLCGVVLFSSCSPSKRDEPVVFRTQDVQSHVICAAYLYGPNIYKIGDTVWVNLMDGNTVMFTYPYKDDYSGYLRRCVILDTLHRNMNKANNFASK